MVDKRVAGTKRITKQPFYTFCSTVLWKRRNQVFHANDGTRLKEVTKTSSCQWLCRPDEQQEEVSKTEQSSDSEVFDEEEVSKAPIHKFSFYGVQNRPI